MVQVIELDTDRLILRQWKDSDYPIFSEMNADPDVMEFFPNTMSKKQSDHMASKIKSLISEQGWGLWAVEQKRNNQFIGFVGLHVPREDLPFTPCVEIGWRLSKTFWGKGFATEAAEEALKVAFDNLNLQKIYSFTSVGNLRSRAVMERINMVNTNQNFGHPKYPVGSPLREHVLYELTKKQWNKIAR